MKNLIRLVTVFIALFLFSTPAFADGIASETAERITHPETGQAFLKVTLNCTNAATETSISTAISGHVLKGRYLRLVKTVPGGTGPTDASDLTLTDADGIDLLDGTGTDLIDNTSDLATPPGADGVDMKMLIDSALTFAVAHNVVGASTYKVILICE